MMKPLWPLSIKDFLKFPKSEARLALQILKKNKNTVEDTLPKTNIAPENRPSQNETSIPAIRFRVLC